MNKPTKKLIEKKNRHDNKSGQKIVDKIKKRIAMEVLGKNHRQSWSDDWDAYSDWDNSMDDVNREGRHE